MPSVFAHFRQSVDPPRDGHEITKAAEAASDFAEINV
jgi:hypothetical protein